MNPPGSPHGHAQVDLSALRRWMDDTALGEGAIRDVAPLTGGSQNVLLRFTRGGRGFVLRRPPAHRGREGDRLLLREARFLEALRGSAVPHPAVIACCGDPAVIGAAFLIMEQIDGFNPIQEMPPSHHDGHAQFAMGMAVVDAIAKLAEIDFAARGLGDLSRSDDVLALQVPRWLRLLEAYEKYPRWPGLAGIDGLALWLEAHRPVAARIGIVHGDCHLGNILFDRAMPAVAALVDWELATIGDPLIDLGTLLATWQDERGPIAENLRVRPWCGFPAPAQLIDRYRKSSGRDLAQIDWYVVLACFRLAIICEGTFARAAAGLADPGIGDQLHAGALTLLRRAKDLIGR